jgi:hypothetical protein
VDHAFASPADQGVVLRVVESTAPVSAIVAEAKGEYDLAIVGVGREWGMEQRTFALRTERLLDGGLPLLVVRAAPGGDSFLPIRRSSGELPAVAGAGGK